MHDKQHYYIMVTLPAFRKSYIIRFVYVRSIQCMECKVYKTTWQVPNDKEAKEYLKKRIP